METPSAEPVAAGARRRVDAPDSGAGQSVGDGHAGSGMDVSEVRLRDILASLARPGRDPREDLPAPVFRRGVVKLEDLQPG